MNRYHSFFTDTPVAQEINIPPVQEPAKEVNGITFVHLPASEFIMGSYNGDGDERPSHRVYVDEFWMMQTEVTKAQYRRCVDDGPCTKPDDERIADPAFGNHPIVGVNWHQAKDYAEWSGGRLPTEAEWEYACRGVDERVYPWGNEAPSTRRLNHYSANIGDTTEVGSYPSDANGLYDMAGNVREWTSTQYIKEYPYNANDGREDQSRDSPRTLRGGSFGDYARNVRCADRFGNVSGYSRNFNGFRVVLSESSSP